MAGRAGGAGGGRAGPTRWQTSRPGHAAQPAPEGLHGCPAALTARGSPLPWPAPETPERPSAHFGALRAPIGNARERREPLMGVRHFRRGPRTLRLSPKRARAFPVAANKRPLASLGRLAPWSWGGSAGGRRQFRRVTERRVRGGSKMAAPEERELTAEQTEKLLQFQVLRRRGPCRPAGAGEAARGHGAGWADASRWRSGPAGMGRSGERGAP